MDALKKHENCLVLPLVASNLVCGNSLAVQWLGLCVSTVRDMGAKIHKVHRVAEKEFCFFSL